MQWRVFVISEQLFPNVFHHRKECMVTGNEVWIPASDVVLWHKDRRYTPTQSQLFSVSYNYNQCFNYCILQMTHTTTIEKKSLKLMKNSVPKTSLDWLLNSAFKVLE